MQNFGGKTSCKISIWKIEDNIEMVLRERTVKIGCAPWRAGFDISGAEPSGSAATDLVGFLRAGYLTHII
jgi:hypothetical protein